MRMPSGPMESALFAPCGMNCMVCHRHCSSKKPCKGCCKQDPSKPQHCQTCKIKACVSEKGLSHCFECTQFPCKKIKSLEKSYQTRYGVSLLANSQFVKQNGLSAFMERQKERFTCPVCGGVVSLHDAACSECQSRVELL